MRESYLCVSDLLLNLWNESLQLSHFLLSHVVLGLLEVSNSGLDNVDGVVQALHSFIKLRVEPLSDSKLVIGLGNNPAMSRVKINIGSYI